MGRCDDYTRKLQINRPICKLSPGWHSDVIQSKSRRNRETDYNKKRMISNISNESVTENGVINKIHAIKKRHY